MKLIMTLVAGICIGMAVVLTLSSNPFAPHKDAAPVTPPAPAAPAAERKEVRPAQTVAVKKVEAPAPRTAPILSTRPPVPSPTERDDEPIRPVTVLKIEQPKGQSEPANNSKAAAKIQDKALAATVLLRVEQKNKLIDCCGTYCAPGVIVASARMLGFDPRSPEFSPNMSIKTLAYGAEPSINIAQVTAFDPETALVFLAVPERVTSPEPLAVADSVASNAVVYVPRYSKGGGQKPEIESGRVIDVWSDPAGLHSFISIDSEFGVGSAGSPCVDSEGRLVAIAGAGHDEAARGAMIHCDALRSALRGRLGAVTVRKTEEKGGLYSFEVAVDSLDPADRIRAAFFYYWTAKPAVTGNMNSGSMIRNRLARAKTSAQWVGTVGNVKLPPGSKIWVQTGYALTGRQVEIMSDPFECAVGLGVPDAPVAVAAADENARYKTSRVESVPRGEEAPFEFVGTKPTIQTVETITTTNYNGTTTVQTVVTNSTPPPPPDSPGWTFGYRTDWSTNRPSGTYEQTQPRGYNYNYYNYLRQPAYFPTTYYSSNPTPVYNTPVYTTPRYYSPQYYVNR